MKKMVALLTIMAMPLLSQAVYVNYNLVEYWEYESKRAFDMGYYLMVIDYNSFSVASFNNMFSDGSGNLGDVPTKDVLYQGVITEKTSNNTINVDSNATTAYLALFNTATFPSEADYVIYGAKGKTNDAFTFGDGTESYLWSTASKHVTVQNTIPEPSSGLLMLAGFSLLALKRKRRACVFC